MEWLKGRGRTGLCALKASSHAPIFNTFLSHCPAEQLQPAQTESQTQKIKN